MLKSLHLKNFKSFLDSNSVPIRPINLLAGANSSGKSSLIQSLLLIKQTIQYGAENRPVAFNGPLLRLGTIDDVRNSVSAEPAFEISFELSVEKSQDYRAPSWQKMSVTLGREKKAELRAFTVTIKVGREAQQDALAEASSYTDAQLLSTRIEYEVEYMEQAARILQFEITPDHSSLFGSVSVDSAEIDNLRNSHPGAEIHRGYIEKFMPAVFLIEYNTTPKEVSGIVDYLTGTSFFDESHDMQDEVASSGVARALVTWAETNDTPLLEEVEGKTLVELKEIIRKLLPFNLTILARASSKHEQKRASMRDSLREALLSDMPSKIKTDGIYIDHIHTIKKVVESYFKDGVRYLGPLREPPKPVYQPEALESFTDVGYRGEHTASVIEINKHIDVRYIAPPDNLENAGLRTQKTDDLEDALTSWLKYLGVAMQVKTTDAGVYGNRLQVATDEEGVLHDLTNVGVGVSQVLPILVSTLLAPQGSLLIFEQPELHLHPKVQSRLADFLISAARMGKQMILETHSEYIIDRLRLRIAEDEAGETAGLINIMFLEQNNGVTEIKPIEVSEYGVIRNWPSDFFDQAEKDSYAIVDAAQKKRQRRKQEGNK